MLSAPLCRDKKIQKVPHARFYRFIHYYDAPHVYVKSPNLQKKYDAKSDESQTIRLLLIGGSKYSKILTSKSKTPETLGALAVIERVYLFMSVQCSEYRTSRTNSEWG